MTHTLQLRAFWLLSIHLCVGMHVKLDLEKKVNIPPKKAENPVPEKNLEMFSAKMAKSGLKNLVNYEAVKEAMAIAQVRERTRDEIELERIASAVANASAMRASTVSKLQQMYELEALHRQTRETTFKHAVEEAFKSNLTKFGLLKSNHTRNGNRIDDELLKEEEAIAQVQERTREELEYKQIKAALETAENERTAEAAQIERMHKDEVSERNEHELLLKHAIEKALKLEAKLADFSTP